MTALAVSGLALTGSPAHAAEGDDVRMISQLNGKASIRAAGWEGFFSGIPSTPDEPDIDLVAERLDPEATISFEYNTNPTAADDDEGWTPIGEPSAPPGRFATATWDATGPGGTLAGTSVALRAVATIAEDSTYSTLRDVAVTGEESDVNSVALTTSDGYFVQPYADSGKTASLLPVDGTTSASDGSVELAWWNSADGTFDGQTNASVQYFDGKIFGEEVQTGLYGTTLDITGYDAEANDDMLAVRALRDTDEVVAVTTYRQEVTEVVVGSSGETGSAGTPVRIWVRDQRGRDIVGAEVRRSSDGELVGYSAGGGGIPSTQENETTETYYVNTTDVDAFEADVDKVSEPFEAPAYVPRPVGLQPVFADGQVFDGDEYADGDIVLQRVDQEGAPFREAGVEISYALHPSDSEPPADTVAKTDEDGRVVVPFDAAGPDGGYTLSHTGPESSGSTTFTTGEAGLTLTPAKGSSVSAGKVVYDGRLAVGDQPLADRVVDLSYTRGVERAPGGKADAGILVDGARKLTATVRTGADGRFKVTISDPPEAGRPVERGGVLRAHAPAADTDDSATTSFGVPVRLTGTHNGPASDRLVVKAPAWVAGERVEVLRKAGPGVWKLVRTARLGRDGADFRVEDRNGSKATRYLVRLIASENVPPSRSNGVNLR